MVASYLEGDLDEYRGWLMRERLVNLSKACAIQKEVEKEQREKPQAIQDNSTEDRVRA